MVQAGSVQTLLNTYQVQQVQAQAVVVHSVITHAVQV